MAADPDPTSDSRDAQHRWRAHALLLTAAVLWSLSGVAVKSPVLADLSGAVIAGYRALFAGLSLLPLVRPGAVRWRFGLVPMVLCFALMNVTFITAMTRTTAAAAIFLQYTATLWAFLMGVLIFREPVERSNVIAMLFGLAGIGLIVANDWSGDRSLGNGLALLSGCTYAGVLVCLQYLRDEQPAWLVALNHFAGGLVLLPWVWRDAFQLTPAQWLLIAGLGAVQMALPYVLFAISVRQVSAQEAALVLLLEPLLNPLWVWLCWGESAGWATLAGGALIVSGLLVRYLLIPAPAVQARRETVCASNVEESQNLS
jgi:drug/metabolite transporter (DMT)-like permease